MIITFLASFIGIALIISSITKMSIRKKAAQEKNFWARENRANSVRRQSLDGLNYIHIPLETFPTHLLREEPKVQECISIIENLASQNIVNLTGQSNTDLKLEYGTANITVLSEYDNNFTLLVRTLQTWADALIGAGYMEEAVILMEFAVKSGTDVSRTYYLLADYWLSRKENSRIEQLIRAADALNSSNKDSIIRHLKDKVWGDVQKL